MFVFLYWCCWLLFDDDVAYPYFVEGTWYNTEASFANNKDLVAEWVSFIVTNAIPDNPNGGNLRPLWRTHTETELVKVHSGLFPLNNAFSFLETVVSTVFEP